MARSFGRAFANKLASEIIKEGNRKRRALHQAQQKQFREHQRVIAKVEREKQAAIKKAQKASYVANKKIEANRKSDAVLAHYDMYHKIFFEALEIDSHFKFKNYKKYFAPNTLNYSELYPEKGFIMLDSVP